MVELRGIEPLTSWMPFLRSRGWARTCLSAWCAATAPQGACILWSWAWRIRRTFGKRWTGGRSAWTGASVFSLYRHVAIDSFNAALAALCEILAAAIRGRAKPSHPLLAATHGCPRSWRREAGDDARLRIGRSGWGRAPAAGG